MPKCRGYERIYVRLGRIERGYQSQLGVVIPKPAADLKPVCYKPTNHALRQLDEDFIRLDWMHEICTRNRRQSSSQPRGHRVCMRTICQPEVVAEIRIELCG